MNSNIPISTGMTMSPRFTIKNNLENIHLARCAGDEHLHIIQDGLLPKSVPPPFCRAREKQEIEWTLLLFMWLKRGRTIS